MTEYLKIPVAWMLTTFSILLGQGVMVWNTGEKIKDSQKKQEERLEKLEKKVDDVTLMVSEFRKEAQEKFVKVDVLWSQVYQTPKHKTVIE